ncbi:MAG: hypothetical protein H7Z17_03905, partial [Fuerstia sp.]|nr:hypothetical protein [Fuerstiella sp.]
MKSQNGIRLLPIFGVYALAAMSGLASAPALTAQTAVVRVLSSSDSGATTVAAPTPDFHYVLRLEPSADGKADSMRVVVAPFVGPRGQRIVPTWTVNDSAGTRVFAIGQFGNAEVAISASLPDVGTYVSYVSLVKDKDRRTWPLVVNRTRAMPAALVSAPAFRADVFPGSSRTMLLTVKDTSGLGAVLYWPTVESVSLVEANNKVGMEASTVTIDSSSDTMTLHGNQSKAFPVTVSKLGAGQYVASFRVAGPSTAQSLQEVTLLLRSAWWWFVLIVVASVAAAGVLKYWTTTLRPQLTARAQIASVREALMKLVPTGTALNADVTRVIAAIRSGLDQAESSVVTTATAADDATADANRKLRLLPGWMAMYSQVESTEPATLRMSFIEQLTTIGDSLVKPLSEAEVQPMSEKIKAVGTALATAVDSQVTKALDDLDAIVTQELMDKASNPALTAKLTNDVRAPLASARQKMATNKAEARVLIDAATVAYARIEAEESLAWIGKVVMPLGASQDRWNEMKTIVSGLLREALAASRPEVAMTAWRRGSTEYLRGLTTALQSSAAARSKLVQGINTRTAEDRKALVVKFTEVSNALNEVVVHLETGDLHGATNIYRKSETALNDLVASIPEFSQQQGGPGQEPTRGAVA